MNLFLQNCFPPSKTCLFELSFALKIGALSLAKMYTVTTTYLHENEMNLEIGLKNFLPKER